MSNPYQWLLAFAAGAALGGLYFFGLWLTVARLARVTGSPALWLFSSLMVRLSALTIALYLISGDDWQRLLAALAGLILARAVLLRVYAIPQSGGGVL